MVFFSADSVVNVGVCELIEALALCTAQFEWGCRGSLVGLGNVWFTLGPRPGLGFELLAGLFASGAGLVLQVFLTWSSLPPAR